MTHIYAPEPGCNHCGGPFDRYDPFTRGWQLDHGFCSESCEDASWHYTHQAKGVILDTLTCPVCQEEEAAR